MPSEASIRRCRNWYGKLLRLYPKAHRERFAKGMEQTFNDLCRERIEAQKGIFVLAVWTYIETSAAIIKENTANIMKDSTQSLKALKYCAIALAALMVMGIATLMFISRGKGEDITGIVAPAL